MKNSEMSSVTCAFTQFTRKRLTLHRWIGPATVAFLLAIFCWNAVAIATAIEIGGDEHYEISKALLWAKGYPLYEKVWSDQPPLFTVLLGLAFRTVAPTIAVGRAVAVLFGVLLFVGCWMVAKSKAGPIGAAASVLLLSVAPQIFGLSASIMQEVPAIAIALWSAYFAGQSGGGRRRLGWLVVSGFLLALALLVKLSAIVVFPAVVAEVALASSAHRRGRGRDVAEGLFVWFASVLLTFWVVGLALGANYSQSWHAHFPRALPPEASALRFSIGSFMEHPEGVAAVIAGLFVSISSRCWRRNVLAISWFVTALCVHLFHRPYWEYYYVHFAVPMAIMGGCAVPDLWHIAQGDNDSIKMGPAIAMSSNILLTGLVLASIDYGGRRLAEVSEAIRMQESVNRSPVVAAARHYAGKTRWVYSDGPIHAFHAGLLMIPELAVVSPKRYWSGEITPEQVLRLIMQYQPEQVILGIDNGNSLVENYVTGTYKLVAEEAGTRLLVLPRLLDQ
jgi:4-amino-4-deoxy-L-arabinose transferase-like glycosyltransferase